MAILNIEIPPVMSTGKLHHSMEMTRKLHGIQSYTTAYYLFTQTHTHTQFLEL